MMRYQELREGRRVLDSIALYLFGHPCELTAKNALTIRDILRAAHALIREELKHPERFNLDGTRRMVKVTQPRTRETA